MKLFTKIILVFSILAFFSCELPDTQDELEDPMPAVWTVLSPYNPVQVFLTRVVPFGQEIPESDSLYIYNADITLEWTDSAIVLIETMIDVGYMLYPGYVPEDTSFRVVTGRQYTLSGNTDIGDFSETFIVPQKPSFTISPDTSVFDNVRQTAFGVSIAKDDNAYEYEIIFEKIGDDREYLPDSIVLMDCYDLRWLNNSIPETVGIPWCTFYYASEYEVKVRAREENYYKYLDYYYYSGMSDECDVYRSPPGGSGYTGVIGALCESVDTVCVTIGY